MGNEENIIEVSETHDKMTKEESESIYRYTLSLYHKGIRAKDASVLIINEANKYNKSLGQLTAQNIYYKVRKEYLQMVPMLSNVEATKEAVLEMEELEDDIINNVTNENPAKYNVILETKKHKHNLLGINKSQGQIEINIGTTDDVSFLSTMNEEVKP